MKKSTIIVIAVIVAVVAAILVSIKYLPLWSTVISTLVAAASFVGGWFLKRWWDEHVNLKNQ